MGVDTTAAKTPARAPAARAGGNNGEPPSEEEFSRLFEEAMKRSTGSSKSAAAATAADSKTPALNMSQDEQKKFLSAMQNPEFRSLLNEYMSEISDPANRAETEQYLAQLESEQKVPEDKLLVRPAPGFVVKAKWSEDGEAGDANQKLFVNVCSSEKMQPPSSTPVTDAGGKRGTSWNLPYSVGPERLEKDKGGAMVLTFDVCFHPTTLGFAKAQRTYRDMVVKTCLDAIEGLVRESRRKPTALLSRDYHVLKGVAYKSGEPVTMCLRKPAAPVEQQKKKPEAVVKSSSNNSLKSSEKQTSASAVTPSEPEAQSPGKEKPIEVVARKKDASNELKLDLDGGDNQNTPGASELLKEVSSTKTKNPDAAATKMTPISTTPALKKIAFKLVYRGKFELLNHMQAEHENVIQMERNRPKELVLEMEFPTHASAVGIDLDVSEQSLKLTTKGYEPLDLKLPFPVFEAKGSAKFDKKARKLVVTLPVQPPPEPKPASVSLVVEEDDDTEDGDQDNQGTNDSANHDEPANAGMQKVVKQDEPSTANSFAKTKTRDDDGFAMLRETAIMVQHDPLYQPRAVVKQPKLEAESTLTPPLPAAKLIELYDDLPPLESCSEGEDEDNDEDNDDDDLVLVEAPVSPAKERRAESSRDAASPTVAAVDPPKPAPFTKKETPTCLSFIVDVAGVDAASVQLDFPSSTSLSLRFEARNATKDHDTTVLEVYELAIDALEHEIDPSAAEFDVASENMVVILTKKAAGSASAADRDEPELSSASPPIASITPVVRFQNQLLYELD